MYLKSISLYLFCLSRQDFNLYLKNQSYVACTIRMLCIPIRTTNLNKLTAIKSSQQLSVPNQFF